MDEEKKRMKEAQEQAKKAMDEEKKRMKEAQEQAKMQVSRIFVYYSTDRSFKTA